MPVSPRIPGSPSTAGLLVRMTPEERARWHVAARSRGTTLAEVARKAWSQLLCPDTSANTAASLVQADTRADEAPASSPLAKSVRDMMADENPDALFADGFDDAILGPLRRCGQPTLVAYSYAKAVEVLMRRDGMEYEEAVEWMEFNVVGAWMGEHTPAWLCDEPPVE